MSAHHHMLALTAGAASESAAPPMLAPAAELPVRPISHEEAAASGPPLNGEAQAAPKTSESKSPEEAARDLMRMMNSMGKKEKKKKKDEKRDDDDESESEERPRRAPAKQERAGRPKAWKKSKGPVLKALKGTTLKSTGSKIVVPPVSQKVLPKFPGVPKAGKEYPPLEYKKWRIYSAMNTSAWRCKKVGVRTDTSCSWNLDPAAGWAKVIKTITKK
jgi:hypothetical protein